MNTERDPVSEVEASGLIYVSDSEPGIGRQRAGKGFCYRHADGSLVREESTLERIRSLAIPPAYKNVWICGDPSGHLQATGMDDRGRKQYRYHPRFREFEERAKFDRMLHFGKALPMIRAKVGEDLGYPRLTKRKVLSVVVYLLEKSLIRVGNREYAKQNRSYGLTTLHTSHVRITGADIRFNFMGKSRIRHRIEIHDARLARAIKRIQDLPGQDLFRYVDEEGSVVSITSSDVNAYLQEVTGEHFTAKDFRTWWGSLFALVELASSEVPGSQTAAKRTISAAMKSVSQRLGNTPAICRKCYVHPTVLESFQSGRLSASIRDDAPDLLAAAEEVLLRLLKEAARETAAA